MRIAVIGIVIERNRNAAKEVNEILSTYGDNIIGRMGVPNPEKEVYVISVIFKGTNESISAMTGRLGRVAGVNVKSAVTNVEI